MPRASRTTALQAENLLLEHGFILVRSRGSHRIYVKGGVRVVVPHHVGRTLHPKIVRQVERAIRDAGSEDVR